MRSVVLKPSPRCTRCQLPPRWCICAAHREIRCPLQIDVLMQRRERFRPSSTGNLIDRVALGVVTDFVRWRWHEHRWPIFNIADVALVIGAFELEFDRIKLEAQIIAKCAV